MTEVLNYDTRRRLPWVRADTLVLLVVISVSLLTFFARGVGGIVMAHLWYAFAAGKPLNPDENDLGVVLVNVGLFAYPTVLVVFPLLIFWMYRAHQKLRRLSARRLGYSSRAAILVWIMPRSFVIRPYEVMKEIYIVSRNVPARTFTPLCGCWWGFWLAALFLNLAAYLTLSSSKERGADLAISYGVFNAISAVPVMIAGAFLIAIVWRVDRAQARRAAALANTT